MMFKSRQINRRQGFTIVELLVVIGIVVVLVALLLPVLTKGAGAARSIVCTSNLRSLGQLASLYADGNRGWLPPVGYPPNGPVLTNPYWFEEIMGVMGRQLSDYPPVGSLEFGIWRCPENAVATRPESSKDGEEYNSYTINAWGQNVTTPENRYMGSKLTWFAWPSELYAMWDGVSYHVDPFGNDGTNSLPQPFASAPGIRSTSYRHNLGVNMLFADGHVSWPAAPSRTAAPAPPPATAQANSRTAIPGTASSSASLRLQRAAPASAMRGGELGGPVVAEPRQRHDRLVRAPQPLVCRPHAVWGGDVVDQTAGHQDGALRVRGEIHRVVIGHASSIRLVHRRRRSGEFHAVRPGATLVLRIVVLVGRLVLSVAARDPVKVRIVRRVGDGADDGTDARIQPRRDDPEPPALAAADDHDPPRVHL